MAGPGFSLPLLQSLAAGIVQAVCAALAGLAPGRAFVHAADLPLVEPVCFNRSLAAYNRNPDVTPVAADRSDEAVTRRMTVLRFEDSVGRPRALLAIFGVHGTSIHADNDLLHPDNPGVAARECERAAAREGDPNFVALFVQAAAGDVTPNYRWHAQRGVLVGRYDDDFEAAAACGEAQARHALRLLRSAATQGAELANSLAAELHMVRFDQTEVDADLQPSAACAHTSVARLGVGFCLGTREGPGPLGRSPSLIGPLGLACSLLSRQHDRAHDPKPVLWDLGPGHDNLIAGRFESSHPLLSVWDDRRMRFYRAAQTQPGAATRPWVPHTLPFQILRIGAFAAALVPFEPTTVAGRRIRSTVARALAVSGVRQVEVLGYANAYAGYLTTPEEYDEQAYEGAATLFGRASLPAVCTRLRAVARGLATRERRTA
jgi:neutral ceramidase